MILSFQLTMPNVGSWNGKWTGAEEKYYKFRKVTNEQVDKLNLGIPPLNFHYAWSDGWGANVAVELIGSVEKKIREKKSAGFCGYEWMIDSILKHGKITTD